MSDTVGTMTLQEAYDLRDKYAKMLEAKLAAKTEECEALKEQNAELQHKMLDELSYLTQLTELEAQLKEAREVLLWCKPVRDDITKRKAALLQEGEHE